MLKCKNILKWCCNDIRIINKNNVYFKLELIFTHMKISFCKNCFKPNLCFYLFMWLSLCKGAKFFSWSTKRYPKMFGRQRLFILTSIRTVAFRNKNISNDYTSWVKRWDEILSCTIFELELNVSITFNIKRYYFDKSISTSQSNRPIFWARLESMQK